MSFFTPVFERGIESNARVPLWQGLKFIAILQSLKLCKIVQGQKKLQSNLQSLLNNERWKVLEALRNIFVKSPQTARKSRDGRLSRAFGCARLFLELLTTLLF